MSQSRLSSCIPLPLDSKTLVDAVEKAKDWALMHGVGMRDLKNCTEDTVQFIAFALLPSPFPKKEYLKAIELQPVLNELMHKIAHDDEFLERTLRTTIQADEFTANLFDIWVKVRKEGIAQSHIVAILRSDYLMQQPANKILQVEFNSYSTSMGAITTLLPDMSRFNLQQLGRGDLVKNIPESNSLPAICAGIMEAYDLFGVPGALVLFVFEAPCLNICDQRFHEFYITETRSDIKILRKTLLQIYEETELNDKKQLVLDGQPIAVVYYRSGFGPAQYHSQKQWDARLRVERSTAIKCPPIQYQLAGTKKVQQTLATPGILERFMGTGVAAERVRDIFAGLYSLDFDDSGERAVDMALADPDRFVLKPEREGGGNNLYGEDLRNALLRMRHSNERAAYILMEKIISPVVSGYLVCPGSPIPPPLTDLVSELGIYGIITGTKDKLNVNKPVGCVLRTKLAECNEGGVQAGFGAFDSLYLIDM